MDELELEFELDARLQNDCIQLGDFPLCRLMLMNDRQYPWFILVPRRAGVTETYHLSDDDQIQLMRESSTLSEALADLFSARKMNIGMLGNIVAQLHVHHIVRQENDPAWPGPVWGKVPPVAYTDEEREAVIAKIEPLLSGEESFKPFNA
jgi:diadenosine tetraphosphate (Ap4A) HIT family hydrolase